MNVIHTLVFIILPKSYLCNYTVETPTLVVTPDKPTQSTERINLSPRVTLETPTVIVATPTSPFGIITNSPLRSLVMSASPLNAYVNSSSIC